MVGTTGASCIRSGSRRTTVLQFSVRLHTVDNGEDASNNDCDKEENNYDPQIHRHEETALELVAVLKRSFLHTSVPLLVGKPTASREFFSASNTACSRKSPKEAEDEPGEAAAAGNCLKNQSAQVDSVYVRLEQKTERNCSGENTDLENATPEPPKEPAAEQDSHVNWISRSHSDTELNCTCGNGFFIEGNLVYSVNVKGSLWIRVTVSIYSQVDHKD